MLTEYDQIVKEQAKFDIIEPALGYQLNQTQYLPHYPIIKDNWQSTKFEWLLIRAANENLISHEKMP